ncbi:ovochymase-2 [Paramisgurnus dabryanus]|uniref:ovochymase-2 n=1 Tax=Paramisgurnus dabryanus TaxID=90735 RepID=UPI003CCF7B65
MGCMKVSTTLEKILIVLFVLLTAVCIGLVVVYVVEKNNSNKKDGIETGCGSLLELNEESGGFSSGNYPSSYDSGMSCSWRITVEANKVIHLWFEDFSVEDSGSCDADFVTLKDELGIIGKYCGYSTPKPIVSVGNSISVYFDSNDRHTEKGFKAQYRAVAPETTAEIVGAGGVLQGDRGELLTPGFPEQNYENGALYQWKIQVPDGERVRLTFTAFDLVPESCGDFVDVYDGASDGGAQLGRFCGNTIPAPVVSGGSSMVVRFKSDSSQSAKGFSAVYTVTSALPVTTVSTTTTNTTTTRPTSTTLPTTASTDSGCGSPGKLFGRKGQMNSMNYPQAYPANLRCSWDITVDEGLLVKLHITDLSVVGEAGQCGDDKLTVSDSQQSLGTHCGFVLPPVLVSVSNKMSLSFQSDARLADRGLSAKWEAVYPEDLADIQGCGGFSQEETGIIRSQNWPLNYPANSMCLWIIRSPKGKTIKLTFTDFDVEAGGILLGRCYDNVVVYDGTQPGAKKYGPYCGTKMPGVIESTSNELVIRFYTDFFTEAKGFRAHWTTDTTLPTPTDPPVPPNPWDDITIDWPESCGKPAIPPAVNTRIVNGEPAKAHSWPWQVSMQVWPESQPSPTFFHTCGGTLIHKNWVMTAAHCFIRYADELHRWKMCLGKHNLTFSEPNEQCFNVLGIYRHEGFRYPNVPTVEFDVALVRLDGEALATDFVNFACLPSVEEVLPGGKACYATGWGDETGNSTAPKVAEALNQVALPVVPYDTCKRMDYWWFQVKPSMICCGYTLPDELKSVCQGDSGGPLVCQDSPSSPWEVHGITSFGPIGCIMDKKPSVFTRSSAYLDWIENIIRKDIYNHISSGCGGLKDLIGVEGTLSSMNYPDSYSNGASCQWNIRVPAGNNVHLHFSNFSLEDTTLCLNDKLTLSDNIGTLGTHCSTTPPRDLVTAGDTLSVSFSSNNKVVDLGFSAQWKAVNSSDIETIIGCGGYFTSQQGELQSPNWPKEYPNQAVCTWTINIPSAKTIYIEFTHFELQSVSLLGQCVDYLEIFNSSGLSEGKFCGIVPPSLSIHGERVTIRFLSNAAGQEKGFRGYWTTDPDVIPTIPPNPWNDIIITWPKVCGTPAIAPNASVSRVVNGIDARPHSWPWQVSMQVRPYVFIPFQHVCGGSLIHEQWVLTAAQCFIQYSSPNVWQMCLGKHHMNSGLDGPTEVCVSVDAIISHEDFIYPPNNDVTNDIALVRLAKPVTMTPQISPVCMPNPESIMPAGHICYVTGWGDEKGSLFPVVAQKLNQASLPIVPYETCSKPEYWGQSVQPSMICAGYESPDELKSACKGDSGGPFVCKQTGSDWEVHGVVSFVPVGCIMDKKPSVFTRVSAFNHWIEDNIKRYIYENTPTS